MATRARSKSAASLEVPRRSTEIQDPGAHELDSSEGDDHYSDASEGRKTSSPVPQSQSPIPRTRVEKVDDKPSHGQIPGSPAYDMRAQDAVPDEVEIIPDGLLSKRNSFQNTPLTPGGTPIPRTVVEKIDPTSPSHGELPGTEAYEKRMADAAPDIVLKAPNPEKMAPAINEPVQSAQHGNAPIPETVISRVDSEPAHGEQPGTKAYDMRQRDATPDVVEKVEDVSGSPTTSNDRSTHQVHSRRVSSMKILAKDPSTVEDESTFGDDFDEFEEGEQAGADDDFGDFDDGFEEPVVIQNTISAPSVEPSLPLPLVDLSSSSSLSDIIAATEQHLDLMFPSTKNASDLQPPEPIPSSSPIFPTDRSRSLWSQLITPPPLQPPNWTKSRIRRLFLVSLGVPVDLDEILPPSKQKKLVLPDINLDGGRRKSESDKTVGSISRLKQAQANDSNASVDSTKSASQSRRRGVRKGPPPPPDLDLVAVRRICATTGEKLDGSDDLELKAHITKLEEFTSRSSEVLEYWLKRRDVARAEKEAFEGVIENLVKHARRVRK